MHRSIHSSFCCQSVFFVFFPYFLTYSLVPVLHFKCFPCIWFMLSLSFSLFFYLSLAVFPPFSHLFLFYFPPPSTSWFPVNFHSNQQDDVTEKGERERERRRKVWKRMWGLGKMWCERECEGVKKEAKGVKEDARVWKRRLCEGERMCEEVSERVKGGKGEVKEKLRGMGERDVWKRDL